jgi:hypothetical protein
MREKNLVILQNQDTSSTQHSGAIHIRKLFGMDDDMFAVAVRYQRCIKYCNMEIKNFRSNVE